MVLSLDDVTAVMKTTTAKSAADDETWSINVAEPAIRLATGTMSHLSRGWGTSTGFTALLFATITILNFIGTVHDIRMGDDAEDIVRRGFGAKHACLFSFQFRGDFTTTDPGSV